MPRKLPKRLPKRAIADGRRFGKALDPVRYSDPLVKRILSVREIIKAGGQIKHQKRFIAVSKKFLFALEYGTMTNSLYTQTLEWLKKHSPEKKPLNIQPKATSIARDVSTLQRQLHHANYNDSLVRKILQIRTQLRESGKDHFGTRNVSEFSKRTRLFLRSLEHGSVTREQYDEMNAWLSKQYPKVK